MLRELCAFTLCIGLPGSIAAQSCSWIDDVTNGVFDHDAFVGGTCTAPPEIVCQWAFDYREAPAESLFARLAKDLSACLGPAASQDAPVNHPDSYRLDQYMLGDTVVSLSLKDKASLQKTFVFLRLDQSDP